eukprot:CAMPEP_0175066510 /NCGR_PEP_ID=MMETSP0052_2-20121109/16551_1 /TAXON_ID=51329 ORGANISM="Polytomella parva, Strain SAG 63-3" /NCGR_SAMPLE_ID=MMETSP0052_2 /ASSEMBLY_ACC=CAM_ASM_000194 /LENGTH=198 /DNA_ID=CAMNT_0016333225 /DNA_START=18 /DNA_END=611 /DNA_ORIENTATION=+
MRENRSGGGGRDSKSGTNYNTRRTSNDSNHNSNNKSITLASQTGPFLEGRGQVRGKGKGEEEGMDSLEIVGYDGLPDEEAGGDGGKEKGGEEMKQDTKGGNIGEAVDGGFYIGSGENEDGHDDKYDIDDDDDEDDSYGEIEGGGQRASRKVGQVNETLNLSIRNFKNLGAFSKDVSTSTLALVSNFMAQQHSNILHTG